MKRKHTKRALLSSVLALVLCFSMMLGTTFAWFTDSVESTNNIIKAGNLDIELEYAVIEDGDIKEWKPVKTDSKLFDDKALWEPGYTQVVYLRVANKGTLALKYQFGINIVSETEGINVANTPFKLSDYINMGIVKDQKTVFADRDAAVAAVTGADIISKGFTQSGEMKANAEDIYLAVVVYMPESVENEANYKTGTTPPQITLGINLFATQLQAESDSFGSDYDKDASWTGSASTHWYYDAPAGTTEFTLVNAEELAGLAEIVNSGDDTFAGKTIKLGADIDLRNAAWTPIGVGSTKFEGAFIGTGYTISNLRVVGENALGLFGKTFTGAHIEGVTIDTAYVSGNDYVGAILGQGYLGHNCIVNCTVTNATIIATPYFDDEKGVYDGGAKAGVIAGQAYNGNITGCTVKDSTVTAYRDLGGIAGMHAFDGKAGNTVEASGNTVEKVTLNYVGVAGKYDGDKPNQNMAKVVGRVGTAASVGENTIIEVTMNDDNAGAMMIFTLDELIMFADEVNGGNDYKGQTIILGADIDLNNMDWTPIGTTDHPFNGVFDGNNKTIRNLSINKPGVSNIGLFGRTNNPGEVKNLTVENATVTGRLAVGVVAGTPYTAKYSNITVKGHVEVNGMAYVGGVGGRNAYANWDNIVVDVDATSYVKANSVENGTAYRTYVGGVIGFMGEGTHTVTNVTSNMDVIGTTCDVGGIVGIAHEGNGFENITCTGDVTITDAAEAGDAEEMGGIAGVWMNSGRTVSFIDCEFTGTLTANFTEGVDLSDNTITGKGYYADTSNELIVRNYYEKDGITYYSNGVTGDVVLAKISENAPAKIEIPEGVTVLGSKVLQGNTTVKEVVIPSSVKNFGGTPNAAGTGASGGMFYQSAVEKVVLPEGLTEIPAAAFNQAAMLTSVNIPSSVKKIGINAFAGSGLTTLEISKNVEEIGYGAFRDMLNLTTVTIEGNVFIPSYAFRACKSLKDVYLNGANVTFGDNMIFTVTSTNNENPNGITVYVQNAEVQKRLENTGNFKGVIVCKKTADENGVYTDDNGHTYAYASDDTALKSAVSGGAATVYLSSGNYNLPGASNSNITISGDETTVITVDKPAYHGSNVTLNGVTVNAQGTFTGIQHVNAVTYNDVTINGEMCLYGEEVVFNNCTFNLAKGQYLRVYGAKEAEFINCTFNTAGKAILVYKDGGLINNKITVTGCTFNATAGDKAGAIANQNCAAIEIDNYESSVNLTCSGNTIDENFSGVWRIKTLYNNGNTVTVNGVTYTTIAIDGKTMTIDSSKNVTVQ